LYVAVLLACVLAQLNFYYVGFLLGLSLHDAYRRPWVARLAAPARRGLIGGLLLLAFVAASHPQTYYRAAALHTTYAWMRLPGVSTDRTVDIYHTLGAAAVLAAVLLSARLRRLTAAPLLRRVGKRAFALYLTHFLLLGSGSSALFLELRGYLSYHASFGLMLLASGIVLVGLTEAFYRLVDVPSHALARWLARVAAAA